MAAGDAPSPLPSVLVLMPLIPSFESALSSRFRLLCHDTSLDHMQRLPLDDFLVAVAAESPRAAIVRTRVTEDLLSKAPSLRCILTPSAGVNHIDLDACARRGIVVANAGTVFSTDVADYAVALLIDVWRHVTAADRYVRQGAWLRQGDYPVGSKLGGKRVGIVGLGSIGSEIAKRLEAFGCVILYYSRKEKPTVSYKFIPKVRDLAAECDVLIVSCALADETRHIINKEVLQALGKDGFIVNIARGAHIDEPELVRSLQQGEIAGAGLDVFQNEPNVPAELFSMDNVVLSAHQAVFTPESMAELYQLMIDNLEAFFSNKPLLTPVTE